MLTHDIIQKFLDQVIANIKADAASKGQKIPANSFRTEVTNDGGVLYAANYFKYLVSGRPPGKQPPPEKMLEWVEQNPHIFEYFKTIYENITHKGLAYIVGRKIGREGTAIYRGDKPGIDFMNSIESSLPTLFSDIASNEAVAFLSGIKSTIK